MDDSKLIRLEAETYRLAVEAAKRRGFATLSELFKAYDAALLRLGSGDAHLTCNRCQRAVDYDDAKRDPRNDEPWCGCSLSWESR